MIVRTPSNRREAPFAWQESSETWESAQSMSLRPYPVATERTMSSDAMPAFDSASSIAAPGPLVPAPEGYSPVPRTSPDASTMTHLEAVEPMSIPKV